MIFTGTFKTYDNKQTYSVTIGNTGYPMTIVDSTENYSGDTVMFDPTPVIITNDRQDLQKRILISQATINLISNTDLTEELFAPSSRTIPVNITCGNNTVFVGYVDPLQFDQGYAHNWEQVQITATDPFGALEEKNVGQLPLVTKQSTLTTAGFINAIFTAIGVNHIYFDDVYQDVRTAIGTTNIKMWNFFGDSRDDYMTLNEALSEICKYFNLYVVFYGDGAHFSSTINNNPTQITISSFKDSAADDSTSLSTDEVYSQANVKCEIEPVDDLIVSIDDKDNLTSDYTNSEVYMNEVISSGNGKTAHAKFKYMLDPQHFNDNGYEEAWELPNYVQILKNAVWDFGSNSYLDQNSQIGTLGWLKQHSGKGAILGFARGTRINPLDDSIQATPTVSPYFVISINGQYDDSSAGATAMETMIQNAVPVCEYVGLSSAILSPPDANVTNYIVISGNILLNPAQKLTGPYWGSDASKIANTIRSCIDAWQSPWDVTELNGHIYFNTTFEHTIPHPNDDKYGVYYQQRWFGLNQSQGVGSPGLYGYLDNEKNKDLQYKYNSGGTRIDQISKLPVLACQLVVGDPPAQGETDTRKWCCERLFDGDSGQNVFEWKTLAEWRAIFAQKNMEDAATAEPYITIGINPAIDDYIVGQSKSISNNVAGINGTAIPITAADALSGNITFKILGPYNTIWNKVSKKTKRKWFFWKKSNFVEDDVPVLQHVSSIMISNLKIEAQTNGGNISDYAMAADNDLVYYSATNPTYLEKLEEDLKICTPLTLDECTTTGVKYQVSNSYVYDTNNHPFYGFGGHMEEDVPVGYTKPEECLVDYYYKEYCTPARIVTTKLFADKTGTNGLYGQMINSDMINNYFNNVGISGNFRIMSYESDLKHKTVSYTFREHMTINNNQI